MRIFKESKADEQKLIDFAGEELAKRFFSAKNRLKAPENDLYYWIKLGNPEELENRLNELSSEKTRSEKEKEASEGAELIYNKDGWKVYHITTYEASVKYGKNTQWCISGSKRWSNGERGEEYFNDYTSKGIKFYFYIKSNDEKYALALGNNDTYQVFNNVDDEVSGLGTLPSVPGLPEFEVQEEAVWDCIGETPRAKKIIIENGVKEIPDYAFDKNSWLEEVVIPASVTTIWRDAFADCTKLTSVTIPDSVTDIGLEAFYGCYGLTSIIIPDSVTRIGEYAFYGCTSLTSVTIPDSVTGIGRGAFSYCKGLTSVAIPASIAYMGNYIFYGCRNLSDIYYKGSKKQWGELYNKFGEYNMDLFEDIKTVHFNYKNESLSEDLSEKETEGPEEGPEYGISSIINTAIQDEWKTIQLYNDLVVNATSYGYEDIVSVIDDIRAEEIRHVGQLQKALETISPNLVELKDGEEEAKKQLNNPEGE